MKVLVTGGAGFIGSVVTELLCEAGHAVSVWDNLKNGHLKAVDRRAEFQRLDLMDAPAMHASMKAIQPDAVVHLAAEALIDVSMTDPGRFYRANLIGGIHLLDAMVASNVSRLVFSSTAATYGQPAHTPITEEMAGQPCNSYGASKWAFEQALHWYHSAHGIRHISLRYFNACGATSLHGEDHRPETHIIPLLFAVALKQRPAFQLFGTDRATPDGTCIRDYVHVVDIARAHLLALDRIDRTDPTAVNLGLGRGYSNREVIATVQAVTGLSLNVESAPRRAGDPDILIAAADRAHQILGWTPQFPELTSMVSTAWNWKQAHPKGYDT
jgi:UDP-glucose 4-epimerase